MDLICSLKVNWLFLLLLGVLTLESVSNMVRRKTNLRLHPKKRTDERNKSKQKSNLKKYIFDIDQVLNESVTRTNWNNRRYSEPKSVPRKHVSKPLKSPCKRTFSEKKRSRIFDSGGRSPSTKKFRFSRKTPLA